jgi:sugar phosphate isomerase/epimerase
LKDHIGLHPDWEHRIPGQGDVDYPAVVMALEEIGFNEAISIETFTNMPFGQACEGGYAALSPLVQK